MRHKAIILAGFLLVVVSILISAQDNNPPELPPGCEMFITYVSVDTANNDVYVHWMESPSPDVFQYYIYTEIKTVNGWEGVKLDSVPAGNSIYVHTNTNAGRQYILYSVTAIDSSGNESERKPDLFSTRGLHSTIHSDIFYDSCNNAMVISWNKYLGWHNNVSGYKIYGRENGGSFKVITGKNPDDSTHTLYKIKTNTHYFYYIEAVKKDGLISRSNIVHKYTYAPDPPDTLIIDYVTVTDENSVEIKFEFSRESEINDFVLLRSSQINSEFNPIKTILNADRSPVIISDSILTGHKPYYYYRIGALNSCLSVIDTSNIACNIILSGSHKNDINTLTWNHYHYFPSGTVTYEIYRQEPDGSFTLADMIDPFYNVYEDNIKNLFGMDYQGKMAYRVHAVENSTGHYSASNVCLIDIHTEMYLPNAFTPNQDGKNDYFKPVMNFIPENYLLIIYNRYGIVIFKSTDPEIGWDGKVNGNQPAPEGVYTYHIEYTSYNGQKKVIKPGTVTLLYP